MKLVKRADKVAFLEVPSTSGGSGTYYRMKGFKSLSKKMNPEEYPRKYVDEYFEVTDIIGMSVSQDFEFDQDLDSPTSEYLVSIIEEEKLGADAIVNIVQVDFTKPGSLEGEYEAVKRAFSVIPESAGDGTEAYAYGGTFRVAGERIKGVATSTDDFKTTLTFSAV